jgi:hypothetical protein
VRCVSGSGGVNDEKRDLDRIEEIKKKKKEFLT